jgi:nitrite reductase/ring-hydroxylating ferredoxin subunit
MQEPVTRDANSVDYKKIGALAELEPHGQFSRWLEDHDVLVYRYEGGIKAVSNICLHFGGPVGFHKMKDGCFTCLWHNFQFSAKDGRCVSHPKMVLREYKVKVEGDSILVQLNEKLA